MPPHLACIHPQRYVSQDFCSQFVHVHILVQILVRRFIIRNHLHAYEAASKHALSARHTNGKPCSCPGTWQSNVVPKNQAYEWKWQASSCKSPIYSMLLVC